jgi:hypothetical protein
MRQISGLYFEDGNIIQATEPQRHAVAIAPQIDFETCIDAVKTLHNFLLKSAYPCDLNWPDSRLR